MTQNRTHTCGELRLSDAGKAIKICGWLENLREVGSELAFAVVRDFYGTTQVVAETADMVALLKSINKESTISVEGTVRERDSKNAKLPTGDIEVVPGRQLRCWAAASHNELPFPINRSREADESHPPEVPLSGPAQPGGEEQHHPPLPGGGRPARRP